MVRRVERESELFTAVLSILREVGYERLTMDAVSARAHVSKATIYRHWPGKPQLVAEALRQRHFDVTPIIDTGTIRGDLLELLHTVARICVEDAPMLQAVGFAMQSNSELAEIVRTQLLPESRCNADDVIRRAVDRGQLPPAAVDFDLIHELVPALLMTRFLAHGQPLDNEYLARVVDQILIPLLNRS